MSPATVATTARQLLKAIPGVQQFARSSLGQRMRYRMALTFERREYFTFTQFRRLPSQFEALTGPVLEFLGVGRGTGRIRIVVLACSNGSEPYSISSELLHAAPELEVEIDASDINPAMIEMAQNAAYRPSVVLLRDGVDHEAFVARTFDRRGDEFVVKPEVTSRVHFHVADALSPADGARIGLADIVFAQNVMCNLPRPVARRLFDAAVRLMKPRAALVVDGVDLDMRMSRTRKHALRPLPYLIERIHNEARIVRGPRYPWYATGLEPISADAKQFDRRYATIFLRDGLPG